MKERNALFSIWKGVTHLSKLTLKQKRFADEYILTGIAEQSALAAGYSKNYARASAHKLLANVGIKEYLNERLKQLDDEKIADIKEIKEFWSNMFRDEDTHSNYRLKASEYLAKTQGAFIDRVEVKAEVSTSESIKLIDEYLKGKLNDRKG